MASPVSCTIPRLPPLTDKSCPRKGRITTASTGLVYNPREISDGHDVKPLRIWLQHGRRTYDVTLKPDSVGAREEISMRHLAETTHDVTKVKAEDQTFLFKGVTWASNRQNIGKFSPLLRDLGVRSGDKILLVSWPPPVSDHASVEALKKLESEMKVYERTKQNLMRQMEVMDHIFGPCGGRLDAFAQLRQQFLQLERTYMLHIQKANALTFDHRNASGQATRRHLVDACQAHLDTCHQACTRLLDRMALVSPVTSLALPGGGRRCRGRRVY